MVWAALNLATFCAAVSLTDDPPAGSLKGGFGCLALRGRACVLGLEEGEKVFEAAERSELGFE